MGINALHIQPGQRLAGRTPYGVIGGAAVLAFAGWGACTVFKSESTLESRRSRESV